MNTTPPSGTPIIAVSLTEMEWLERFKPKANPVDDSCGLDFGNGCTLVETYDEHLIYLDSVDPKCIWTVLESEGDEGWVIVNDRHFVNRLGYVVTEEPWDREYEVQLD